MSAEWLIAMRLADMWKVHPQMETDHVCSECGERLGIYPSGQGIIRQFPDIKIVCHRCIPPADGYALAPGALEETKQSVRKGSKA